MITIFLWKICRLFGTFTLDYVYLYDSIKVSLSVVYGGHRVHGLNLEVVCFCDDLFCPKIINGHTKLCHHPIFAQTKIVGTLNCRPLFHLLINFAPNGLDSNWGRYPESHFHWFLEEISHYKIRICIYIFISSIIRKSYNYNISPIDRAV